MKLRNILEEEEEDFFSFYFLVDYTLDLFWCYRSIELKYVDRK